MIRALLRGLALVVPYGFVASLVVLIALRPWHRDWGSEAAERARRLPGDEHASAPERAGDRAIAIDAPAEVVWSWLVQIGQDRGGFYSYASLENAAGVRVTNATHVVPGWQTLRAGDFVRATPPDWLGGRFGDRIGWEVDHVEEGRLLSLRYWIFEVEPTSATTSRLHVRTHAGDAPVPIAPLLFTLFEPAHFIMERGMLQGIKERAEHGEPLSWAPVPRAHLERSTVATGDDVVLVFDEPLAGRAVDQIWVALQGSTEPPSDTTGRVILDRGTRSVRLRANAPGDLEVRIHGRYPKEESHLLARIPVKAEGRLVRTGHEQLPGARAASP